MKKCVDMTGLKFSRLLVIDCAGKRGKSRKYFWNVVCDCGTKKVVSGASLRTNAVKSCGCIRSENMKAVGASTRTHGMTKKSIYAIWDSMHQRCINQNRKDFPKYGGRGISVCDEWKSFDVFLADMGDRPKGLSLDRIDNSLGYSKVNCRWATAKQQNRNQSTNVNISFQGETMCIAAWSEKLGINKITLQSRLRKYGWSVERALTTHVSNG